MRFLNSTLDDARGELAGLPKQGGGNRQKFNVASLLSWAVFVFFVLNVIAGGSRACAQGSGDSTRVKTIINGTTMGPITYHVTAIHLSGSISADRMQSEVQTTLDRVNGLMSTYIPESDVSRFNTSQSMEFIPVNSETAKVVARSLEISRQTAGAFDVTIGPAVDLWNFGPEKSEFVLPTPEQIEAVLNRVGYKNLSVQMNPPALRKSIPSLRIDLSAIAKGYAVDEVARTLRELGIEHYMVEVGGEVACLGERLGGGKWRVRVQRPDSHDPNAGPVAAVSGLAMATSGDYRNFVQRDGIRYSHTIDPKTGRPVKHSLASACIIAGDCMTADALATAVMVMGAKRGSEFCDEVGVEYLLTERDVDAGDRLSDFQSEFFPTLSPGDSAEAVEKSNVSNRGASILPTFLAAAVVFALVIAAMAVGSIFGNKPVQGSCGGLANVTNEDGETNCGVCSKPVTDCVERQDQSNA